MPQRSKCIKFYDEMETIIKLLKDKYKNHRLDEVIKTYQILRLRPVEIGQYPCIRLQIGSYNSISLNEVEDNEGTTCDMFQLGVLFDCVMHEHQTLKYGGTTFKGAEHGLYVLRDIIIAILGENQEYEDPDHGKIAWSDATLISMDWLEAYDGDEDAVAISMAWLFTMQKTKEEESG